MTGQSKSHVNGTEESHDSKEVISEGSPDSEMLGRQPRDAMTDRPTVEQINQALVETSEFASTECRHPYCGCGSDGQKRCALSSNDRNGDQ